MKKVKLDPDSQYLADYLFFENPYLYDFTHRQLKDYEEIAAFVNWGRKNPVLFAEELFGIEMMDYQKYAFTGSWLAQFVVWLMGRNLGKSILGAVYLQTRALLVPNFTGYIIAGVGSQSIETFTKIENLTYNKIPSFTTLTDVFRGELIMNSNSNGFIHSPSSHKFELYNHSQVFTINGNISGTRSKRSNCNFYDEAAFSEDEQFRVTEPFLTQNAEFKLGVGQSNLDQLVEPNPFPNQAIYASSAGTKEQYLYHKYRECSLRMDAGDPRYFCVDLIADVALHATQRGVPLAKPLLTQEVIDARLREDKIAGMREYYNEFEMEDLDQQIVSRADIVRNSVPRVPELRNPDNRRKYIITYDPARMFDNSVVVVAELINDEQVGWKAKIVNIISLIDIFKENKTPMNTPAQIEELKKIILAYNGDGVADYENIDAILVDAGSGGAGVPITDFLCESWSDAEGNWHRGLIDNEYNEGDKKKFPDAINGVLKLISPRKYKSELFESLIKMIELDLIEFTEDYLDKGYINLIYEEHANGKRVQRFDYPTEEEEEALLKKGIKLILSPRTLTKKEEVALKQIDLAKRELTSIYRYKQSSGQDRFDLAPEKANIMHDDKAYAIALLAYRLAQIRRAPILNKKKTSQNNDLVSRLPMRKGVINKMIG